MTGKPAFYAKPVFVTLGILGFLLSLTGCTGENLVGRRGRQGCWR